MSSESPHDQPAAGPLSAEHVGLGLAIRELRRAAQLSQEELATRSGMHRTYVGGIERGERNVSFSNLARLAQALGVLPSELLARGERLRPTTAGCSRGN